MSKTVKIILSIFLVTSLAILSGCSQKNINNNISDFNYKTDMQIFYNRNGVHIPMTKSDTGYYYVGDDNIVLYVDKDSMEATPLCFKPNCLHDDPAECDAYFNISNYIPANAHLGTNIQYYEDNLYMVCGEYDESNIEYNTYLMRCDKDGHNRVQLTDYFKHSFYDWFIHRGYFYYTDDKSILRIPISSPKSTPETVYECKNYSENSMDTFQLMCAYGDYLYVTVCESDDNGKSEILYICINLNTSESKQLPEFNDNTAFYREFIDDKMIMQYLDKDTQEFVFLKSNLDGSDPKEFYREEKSLYRILFCDGNYFYSDNSYSMYNNANAENKEQIIYVYDNNMNKIDSFKLPSAKNEFYEIFDPQDNEFFLLETTNNDGERMLVIADKSQIGSLNGKTIKYQELCKLDWYKNKSNDYVTFDE